MQHTQQGLFLLSGLSPQLPSQHLPGGKPATSEINERGTVVSKDTAKWWRRELKEMLRDEISRQPKVPSRFSFGPDYRPNEVQSDFRLQAHFSKAFPPLPLFLSMPWSSDDDSCYVLEMYLRSIACALHTASEVRQTGAVSFSTVF